MGLLTCVDQLAFHNMNRGVSEVIDEVKIDYIIELWGL